MSSSGGVFSDTLQTITTTKLNELSKKRTTFEDQKASLLKAAELESDQKQRLRILIDGVKDAFAIKTVALSGRRGGTGRVMSGNDPRLEVMLKNVERFLEQARYDPSISSKLLQDWEVTLTEQLNVQGLKYQYATLYGELVTEWLSSEHAIAPVDDASEKSDDFEDINIRKEERDAGRAEWEKLVFDPFETDHMAITTYLSIADVEILARILFGKNGTNKQATRALEALRRSVEDFETTLSGPNQFNESVLRWTIAGLLASGLLTEEKRAALKDFLSNPIILAEVADVLNMRMASLDSWSWEIEGLPVEQRRHLTGKFHIYIDEDLLQAIFLQYIGVKWCVFFKKAFTTFSNSDDAWTSLREPIPILARKRREYFLGSQKKKPSAQSKRQGLYKSIWFMSQLPDSEYQDHTSVEGDEEAEYDTRPMKRSRTTQSARMSTGGLPPRKQMAAQPYQQAPMPSQSSAAPRRQLASKAARKSAPSSGSVRKIDDDDDEYAMEDEEDKPNSPMETKQFLLHLLSTEMIVNTRLHGEFTCARSEFDSWSPSLPHSTIYAVLSFFGLSKRWLEFFRKFLEAPLKFVEDGTSAKTRTRKRGAPGAHSLSLVCGEAILFCMDYAVNQHANGAQLYRMHDDFWVWSPLHKTVVKAWEAINEFADTMGVSLNEGKTGCVRIMGDSNEPGVIDPGLPDGEIRWGFLQLDPKSGHFVIDQTMVDKHIEELQLQLQDKKSLFSWIQAWNTYAGRFFTSNFGKPANCFGRQHVDAMLESLERIQRKIFSDTNVVEYLKNAIQDRFGVSDIPDGYLYFPTSLGGLDLHNPFIGLVQLRDSVYEHPASALDDFLQAEMDAYRSAKVVFENGQLSRHENIDPNFLPEDGDVFMEFKEFIRYREEFACDWEDDLYEVFTDLLTQPTEETVDMNQSESVALNAYPSMMTGYWRWVAQLYGPDMRERFGGLNIVDAGLLPIGMVNLFRSGRVKWQG
ncbi:Histone [Hyphodiscus hymeniophilus]|uniref:Histone n=1 Tax=Hyphodiscus hymeniophilus TaxID=353542 RepID=A0A9P7B156_9HELO|nr:Histone [Hyphodiscus hymeniophilus]